MRHAETQIGSLAVFQTEHVVAHHPPASAGLPQLPWMNGRQIEFLSDFVHLLADDTHDLVKGALSHEEIGVNPGGQLADISGAHQELVTGDFSVCWRLAQSGNKELRP